MAEENDYDELSTATESDYTTGGTKTKSRKSALFVDPRRHLGLEFNKSRSALLALALSHPVGYYNLRQEVITLISEKSIMAIYEKMWDILNRGEVDGTKIEYVDKDGNKHHYNPALPESRISKIAMSVAEQMLKTSQSIVDEILPQDYLALAQRTSKAVNVAKGVNI
jgi:hypothetical protein